MNDIGMICISIGIILFLALSVLFIVTESKNKDSNQNQNNHAVTPRRTTTTTTTFHRRTRNNYHPPLPPRASSPVRAKRTVAKGLPRRPVDISPSLISANAGPNGVTPIDFPCCPYDRQRNKPGMSQLIKWDRNNQCYVCSKGHKFKSNGKPIFT
jgi:hypothetical protein